MGTGIRLEWEQVHFRNGNRYTLGMGTGTREEWEQVHMRVGLDDL